MRRHRELANVRPQSRNESEKKNWRSQWMWKRERANNRFRGFWLPIPTCLDDDWNVIVLLPLSTLMLILRAELCDSVRIIDNFLFKHFYARLSHARANLTLELTIFLINYSSNFMEIILYTAWYEEKGKEFSRSYSSHIQPLVFLCAF